MYWLLGCLLSIAVPLAVNAETADPDDLEGKQATDGYGEFASPRDTLNTFLVYMGQATRDQHNKLAWRQVFRTLEIPESAGEERKSIALKLLGVFNGLGQIYPEQMAPGADEVAKQKLTRFEFLPRNSFPAAQRLIDDAVAEIGSEPPGRVLLARGASGDWRFSPETLNEVGPLWAWIEKRGVRYGVDITQLSAAERFRRDQVPDALKGRFVLDLELWQWFALLLGLLAAVITDFLSRGLFRPVVRWVSSKYIGDPDNDAVRDVVRPIGLFMGALLFWLLLGPLNLLGGALLVLVAATKVVLAFSGAWLAWAIADLVAATATRNVYDVDTGFRDMLIPLLRKAFKLFILAIALIYAAASLNINILPLLGSVGLAGLAISFAAQDLIRNIFGGIAVFLDQPFKLGDRILYKGYDGTIEHVGFRSTKVRTLAGHLVTIPNGGLTNEPVENVTLRPSIRRIINVTITYDTPPQKIEQAVSIIRSVLEEQELREPIHQIIQGSDYPPRVYFNELNADSLNILVVYWYAPPAYWDYLEHAQKVNLRIFEEFEKAGIDFAFPTQTLHLAGDRKRELVIRMLGEEPPPQLD